MLGRGAQNAYRTFSGNNAWSPKPVPITFKRTRSNEPKPFEDLTYKSHCAACKHDATVGPR